MHLQSWGKNGENAGNREYLFILAAGAERASSLSAIDIYRRHGFSTAERHMTTIDVMVFFPLYWSINPSDIICISLGTLGEFLPWNRENSTYVFKTTPDTERRLPYLEQRGGVWAFWVSPWSVDFVIQCQSSFHQKHSVDRILIYTHNVIQPKWYENTPYTVGVNRPLDQSDLQIVLVRPIEINFWSG